MNALLSDCSGSLQQANHVRPVIDFRPLQGVTTSSIFGMCPRAFIDNMRAITAWPWAAALIRAV
jgi:hypothetical protein